MKVLLVFMPFGCDYVFKKKSSKKKFYTSMWPTQTTERSEVTWISSESPVEILKALQTSRFKNVILGFQSEKGSGNERAEPKLKPAQAIMCSVPISVQDKADHLLLKQGNSPYWVHFENAHSYSNTCSVILYYAFHVPPSSLLNTYTGTFVVAHCSLPV